MEVALLVPGHWALAKKTPVVAWAFEGGRSHPRADLGAPRDGHCTMKVVPAGSRAPARQTPTPPPLQPGEEPAWVDLCPQSIC